MFDIQLLVVKNCTYESFSAEIGHRVYEVLVDKSKP